MLGLFFLTLACAFVGGTIGYKLRLPAGTLIGAMLGVTVLNLLYGDSHFYIEIRVVLQLISGAMIGSRISRKDMHLNQTLLKNLDIILHLLLLFSL